MYYDEKETDVLLKLKTSEAGISQKEAERRLLKYGKNELQEAKKSSLIKLFFAQMKDLMIIVLLCAAVVSAILAIANKEYYDLIDSAIILLAVILNSIIGVIQQGKADKSMELLKNMNRPYAKVIRDNQTLSIKSEEIVIGDIVVLEAGDSVPADLRIIKSHSLKIEEATLTGESLPQEKFTKQITNECPLAERKNMAFSSTSVVYGRGLGVVVATGTNTEVGKIANMLTQHKTQNTPLQGQLNKTAKLLSIGVLIITLVIFVASLIKNGFAIHSVISSFMTAVALAVAAIPEGLAAVVTIVLAVGVKEMSKRNSIVKRLPAVETLGCCNIICSDKTGTITLNKMTVKSLYTYSLGLVDTIEANSKANKYLINGMLLCNDTQENDAGEFFGDPTETALTAYFKDRQLDYADIIKNNPRVNEYPFDSNRKMMTTVNSDGKDTIAYTKGALDKILPRCSRIIVNNTIREITEEDKSNIILANKSMADNALRVLGFAINQDLDKENNEKNMTFVGMVGMIDPPRPEVIEAVKTCEKAGMRAIMITGDHLDTAIAIAKEVGIYKEDSLAITGEQLDKLSDEEFFSNLDKYSVFARVSPENKVRIVKAFKEFDNIVAMTGDGVNDAPSIKVADVGVGMGITGTDVSKEAADMVLADDNFATIVGAVKEGRKVYSNIQKAIKYLLSANIAEVLTLLIATLFILPAGTAFLTPALILWVNLVTDSLPALSLAYEQADKDVMTKKPRDNHSSLFRGRTGQDIIIEGVMQTVLVLISYCVGVFVIGSYQTGTTMAFVTLSLIQLFHAYNCKSNKSLFNKGPFDNHSLNYSFLIGIFFVLIPTITPGLANLFGLQPLNLLGWLIALVCAFAIIPIVEVYKNLTANKD